MKDLKKMSMTVFPPVHPQAGAGCGNGRGSRSWPTFYIYRPILVYSPTQFKLWLLAEYCFFFWPSSDGSIQQDTAPCHKAGIASDWFLERVHCAETAPIAIDSRRGRCHNGATVTKAILRPPFPRQKKWCWQFFKAFWWGESQRPRRREAWSGWNGHPAIVFSVWQSLDENTDGEREWSSNPDSAARNGIGSFFWANVKILPLKNFWMAANE